SAPLLPRQPKKKAAGGRTFRSTPPLLHSRSEAKYRAAVPQRKIFLPREAKNFVSNVVAHARACATVDSDALRSYRRARKRLLQRRLTWRTAKRSGSRSAFTKAMPRAWS